METTMRVRVFVLACCLGALPGRPCPGQGMSTAFTYQGALMDANQPADGFYDLRFRLYDHPDPNTGLQVGDAVTVESLDVIEGYFTVELDFGARAFDGGPRWLELAVRAGELQDPNEFTVLLPRQRLTPTPYAIHAETAGSIVSGSNDTGPGNQGPAPVTRRRESFDLATYLGGFDALGVVPGTSNIYELGTNVGICTPSPWTILHAALGARTGGILLTGPADYANNAVPFAQLGYTSGSGTHLTLTDETAVIRTHISSFGSSFHTGGKFGFGVIDPRAGIHVRSACLVDGAARANLIVQDSTPFAAGVGGGICFGGRISDAPLYVDAFAAIKGVKENAIPGDYAGALSLSTRANGAANTEKLRITSAGDVGIGTSAPQARLHVAGTTRTQVLEITGGSDLAEPFKLTNAQSARPGMVVCIDPDHTGRLRVSDRPYDRTVAGVISGANGVRAGLTMKQQGTLADGSHPVALTGRVYCLCDASNGPIRPGDLLTTSATPGHAMKVSDHAAAAGAVLGKAMSGLEVGKGLVLVLVSLQ